MRRRLIWKTISWQTIGLIVSIITAWWWFGGFINSLGFVGFELIVFSIIYYIHELIWRRGKT